MSIEARELPCAKRERRNKDIVHRDINVSMILSISSYHCCAARVYVVPYHIIQMMNMLKDQVLHHSFTKATATLETVAMAMDQVPDILRVIGVERLTSDPRSYKEAVKLFKYMFTWQPQHVRVFTWQPQHVRVFTWQPQHVRVFTWQPQHVRVFIVCQVARAWHILHGNPNM